MWENASKRCPPNENNSEPFHRKVLQENYNILYTLCEKMLLKDAPQMKTIANLFILTTHTQPDITSIENGTDCRVSCILYINIYFMWANALKDAPLRVMYNHNVDIIKPHSNLWIYLKHSTTLLKLTLYRAIHHLFFIYLKMIKLILYVLRRILKLIIIFM